MFGCVNAVEVKSTLKVNGREKPKKFGLSLTFIATDVGDTVVNIFPSHLRYFPQKPASVF